MMNLDDGLAHLKIDVDCVEMATWVVAFREISVYVTNPSEKYVDQLLLGEMYADLRKLWPKCELRELNEVDLKGAVEFDGLDDLENLIDNDHYDDQWWADIEARFDKDEEGPNTWYNDEVEALEDLGPTWNDGPIEYEKEVFQNSDELVEKDYDYDVEDDDRATSVRKGKKNLVNAPVVGHVLYNKNIHLDNPILLPNMVFGSAAEFRELIRSYSVKTKKGLIFVKNDRWRQQVKCCDEDFKYLARKYVNKIRREPTTTISSFIGDVSNDINVEIIKTMAWRAIKAAGYLMYGDETQ
ncbi:hypothetical protein LIER_13345 [Lithospermum erythrorhizon]|uniref:Transposase n=1 Tax=Lithospermum erythrorhizon TaxID=34254 RepID=A0AAV3PV37_LITER